MSNAIYHGGRLDLAVGEYGGNRSGWLDLSTGINPHAYPVTNLPDDVWIKLPDSKAEQDMLDAARRYFNVRDGSGIVAGNGTQALIELLPRALPLKKIAIVSPTYGEHAFAWKKAGADVVEMGQGETVPADCDGLLIVNPNNPDGHLYEVERLVEYAAEMAKRGGYLIVDEAFCDSFPRASIVSQIEENMLVYRSFGKFFGLAGLRLGLLIARKEITGKLIEMLGPWSVSGPALEIGKRAFKDHQWTHDMRLRLQEQSAKQAKMLQGCGLEIAGINPLFIYTAHPRSNEIYHFLAKRHILVRPFPAMKERLRFGLCADSGELERLEDALRDIMRII